MISEHIVGHDDLDRPIYDRKDEYNEIYKTNPLVVQQVENNVLIVWDNGDEYEVSHIWLADENDITRVQGSTVSHFYKSEIDLEKPLFEQLQLF